jgi:hypothetical protein
MEDVVYRVERRVNNGDWEVPRYGAYKVKTTLSTARGALSTFRINNRPRAKHQIEYRLVALRGKWTPMPSALEGASK